MMNNILDEKGKINSCTGCGMCSAVCPESAIKIETDGSGYYRPVVDAELCISCGICKKTCYCYENDYNKDTPEVRPICYSAKNRDENELQNASSGAVSIELMRACLEAGYHVVGTAYDYDKDIAVVKTADAKEELFQFRGSKYFPSYTEDAFREIVKNKQQKYAVFGTPCQIYAVSRYCDLMKCRERFLFVDIFCHGCPSLNLWTKYLESKKQQFHVEKFDSIRFRSKTYGWHEYCIDFIKDSRQYSSEKYNDPFFEMFFGKDIMNHACYSCMARSSIAKTDIRLGDFWGWQYDLDKKGVSAVVINSEAGRILFDKIKDKFIVDEFPFEDVIQAQSYGKEHSYDQRRRKYLLSELASEKDIHSILKTYRKMFSKTHSVKRILKNMIKRFGGRYYLILRRENHKNESN